MTAEQAPLLVQQHNNRQLFSDYYLNEQLPDHPDWKTLAREAEPVMRQVRGLLDAFVPTSNEAQTERNLIQPMLDLLGHDYLVQASLQAPGAPSTTVSPARSSAWKPTSTSASMPSSTSPTTRLP